MFVIVNKKKIIRDIIIFVMIISVLVGCILFFGSEKAVKTGQWQEGDLIKWVDFNVSYEALDYAIKQDIKYHDTETHVDYIELLSYITARNGNNFKGFKTKQMDEVIEKLKAGESMVELSANLKYYNYYYEIYTVAIGELVGSYEIEVADENSDTGKTWETRYGVKLFSPIAKNYYYNDCDDFGNGRSYGYKRKHLGHDMMGSIGTPILAVEGGVIEELGWNQYGGWRVGIRSYDKKRYYYYAHLRKNFPFNKSLQIGSEVKPGDVIGYMGRTGYSTTENFNGMQETHLHFGLELVFDGLDKERNNEIWIDVYPLIKILSKYRVAVVKDEETKEYSRVYNYHVIENETEQ